MNRSPLDDSPAATTYPELVASIRRTLATKRKWVEMPELLNALDRARGPARAPVHAPRDARPQSRQALSRK